VHGENVRATIFKRLDIALWLNDHQMHVHNLFAVVRHRLHHGHAVADVWYEDPVHDVDMEPIGLTFIDHLAVALKVSEICG
jgi:hypothetical protein